MGKGSHDEYGSTLSSTQWFLMVTIAAQIAGIIAFILIAVLLGQYQGGFAWGVSLFLRYRHGKNRLVFYTSNRIFRRYLIIIHYL
jgi:hypothetical protein